MTIYRFFTVNSLMERWGVTRETIMEHVNAGNLGFVDLGIAGAKRGHPCRRPRPGSRPGFSTTKLRPRKSRTGMP